MFSVHLLRINQGGFCSQHRHERKINHFHVISGRLAVHLWPRGVEQDQPDTTELTAGQSFTVELGVWHSFTALTPTLALEVYEAAPVEDDIIRRTVGGNINRISPETEPEDEP